MTKFLVSLFLLQIIVPVIISQVYNSFNDNIVGDGSLNNNGNSGMRRSDEIRRSNNKEKRRNRPNAYGFIGGFGYFGRLDESDSRKPESNRNRRRDYENTGFDFGAIVGKSVTDDVPRSKIRVPVPVNISGVMFCNRVSAYAVLINIVEEVPYEAEEGKKYGKLRISNYKLSDRDGYFEIVGRRYIITDLLLLNITHHCLPNSKRKKYRNCFTNIMYRIRSDLKNMRYNVGEIYLDRLELQNNVQCREWPYEYPQFVKDYIAKNPT
ncbi:unnamed protein product [Brugia timori]|uniref:Uncharacterized protein n=1 Tax=Brugia timori TaxID=42155 RepID=A0A0R3QSV5_9BILA|nr:unnamed protein product [Brugia timori]